MLSGVGGVGWVRGLGRVGLDTLYRLTIPFFFKYLPINIH